MFYLTYRPQTISELDNTSVRNNILQLLKRGSLPHALLFVGTKGMGKTSTARIVAKALNCERNKFGGNGDSPEPCNECLNCRAITAGTSPDIIEQDAASNRGIDEIRKLIKEASFAAMTSRFRVFIIDEAHMITKDAFNALLKTLEEPPKNVLFILATTNEEKLPSTIISRCYRLNFGEAHEEDIEHMLDRIAKKEKIDLNEDVKKIIIQASDRSFRNAAKILEELHVQEKLTPDHASDYLGIRSTSELIKHINHSNIKETLHWIEEFSQSGGNIQLLMESLLKTAKTHLLQSQNVSKENSDLTISTSETILLMKKIHSALQLQKIAPIPTLPLEIALVEYYDETEKK